MLDEMVVLPNDLDLVPNIETDSNLYLVNDMLSGCFLQNIGLG